MVYIQVDGRRSVKLSSRIKPISYLKAHAAEIVRTIREQREPLIITQNGEAKAVMQDIGSYEQMQETISLLKILGAGQPPDRSRAGATCRRCHREASRASTGWLMPLLVQLTDDAARDLEEIWDYIDRYDGQAGRIT